MSEFDEKARGWDADPARVERARVVAEAIREQVPLDDTMRVLDYGCGTGLLGFALLPHAAHVTFADTSEGMLEIVREKLAALGSANADVLLLDLTSEPPPAERYDVIASLMTLHHVEDVDMILRRFRTLCSPRATLCIADLEREDGSFHGSGFTGHHGFERESLAAAARRAGFHPVAYQTVHVMTRETEEGVKNYPLFLLTGRTV
ncbi:MAG: class I SAM-dependent methyltransferase [Bacteroidetes bacterium]|nr:class I SAM-dependent methyltransferase [Bacteroidota bacterium]